MKITRLLVLFLLSLSLASCSAKRTTEFDNSKLLLSIEERDFKSDKVTEFNFFDSGLSQEIIVHSPNSEEDLFTNKFEKLNEKELTTLKSFEQKLSKLDYENSFPWKEGLYDRGNVYKISFISSKKLEYLNRTKKNSSKEIKFEKVLYYYEGHKDSPELFKEIVEFIKEL